MIMQASRIRPSAGRHKRDAIIHNVTSSFDVKIVRNLADLEALTARWNRLLRAADNVNPYNTPASVLTWYRYRDPASIYVVTVWHNDELVGISPFSLTRVGPFRLLTTAGAEHSYGGEPLAGGPDTQSVATMIANHVHRLVATGFTVVNLRRLVSDGPMARALNERTDITVQRTSQASHSIVRFDFIPDADLYFRQLARKNSVSRRSRRLAEQHDKIEYVANDEDVDSALAAMKDMLSRRFQTGHGPVLFSTVSRDAFAHILIHELVKADQARISTLNVDGRRVTVQIELHAGDRIFLTDVAYEPDLAKYGLGNIHLLELLRRAYSASATEVDLGSDRFSYKHQWANSARHYESLVLLPVGWRGKITFVLRRAAMSLRARRLKRFGRTTAAGGQVNLSGAEPHATVHK